MNPRCVYKVTARSRLEFGCRVLGYGTKQLLIGLPNMAEARETWFISHVLTYMREPQTGTAKHLV